MKRLSRAALAVVATTAVSFSALAVPAFADEASNVELNILGVTDFHGHIEQKAVKDDDGVITGYSEMGASGVACYVDAERADNPNTSFITVGDNIGGSPFVSSILKDEPTLQALSAIGVDASALGNHEFDQGYADLTDRVSLDGTGSAQFPYLGANVEGGTPAPAKSKIIEMDGVKIAYVGAVTEETATLVSPAGIEGITFTGDIDAINTEADRVIEAGEADVVIALIHAEAAPTDPFSSNVDVVFSGHTHFDYIGKGEEARGDKQPLVVIQGHEYGKVISDVEISYDREAGKITNIEAKNVSATDVVENCETPIAAVDAIVAAAVDAAEEAGNEVVATIDNGFYRGADEEGTTGSNRGVESSLSNLIAEAGLWAVNDATILNADIGIMNAGGVRADLEAGEVTFADAYATQNFSNTYGARDLTGAQFKKALEQQWKETGDRPRLALGLSSNVQYSYDETREYGDRITHITFNGEPMDMKETYRVTGSSFLLAGGDSFTAFAEGGPIAETGMVDIDLFNNYIAAHPDVDVRANQSSVGITLSGPGVAEDGTLVAGEELTVELSSLSYTGPEEKPSTVEVTVGSEKKTADVDNTIVPRFDSTGKATVTLAVPEGATSVKIATDNGTTFELPVTVEGDDNGNGDDNTDDQASGSSAGSLVAVLGVLGALGGLLGFFLNSAQGAPFIAQLQATLAQFM
ncbi:5'-nucleotidase [[Brevibacterium] flavum]|uniref:5'-nucleotidase n=1 Tax=[Brevibacterium] flavum TaxID=92706 RepID=A0A0F6Z4D3_9CORY|nr:MULTISPECIES: bifunctional UDP-sugar hydrolase/5'-nucleotidase [Corynebacterium]AKF26390.1 5'-nucleotidase [[Brevibacterium] flavum]ANE07215.1 bifunctional metallophosphatase/5'-nucleotidase [Corynebacterium glutamicum]AST19625.1 bifunctional metallophosphatase/5'-nucleotidase [Corynebacterium glutamicum ATCC 14067]KEI22077.1 5'-nucleotidase [Corynebacterium glutamicum ATCC 14067]KIH74913.1 5'-nucleotidase [Corynebacterium glutamicum]